MLISEVRELIHRGEGAKLEFKRDDIRAEQLAREIVSFANMNGGCILLGVEDDGAISGVQRNNLQAWVMDSVIGRLVHPHIHPDYEEITLDDKEIVVLTIHMGTAKPYVLKQKDRQDIYVRYGNTCQLTSREQQARLFESSGLISAEKFPVYGSSVDELDKRRYTEYFVELLGEEQRTDWHEFLVNRSFLVNGQSALHCSYFAYALFAKSPQLKLPQAGARVTVYPGNDKDYDTLLDENLNVPLIEYHGDSPSSDPPTEGALHDRIIDMLRPHISRERLTGTTRKLSWDYPFEAIRELLVNAFIHRDWTRQNYVRVVAYDNRLEVISPGALPNGITIEKIKFGQQSPRNPNCIRIFRDYGYLEDQGMGIRRKVIPLTLEHTGKEPEFEASEDYFKVVLWKGTPDVTGDESA